LTTSPNLADITRRARKEGWSIDRFQDAIADPSVKAPRDWSGFVLGFATALFVIGPVVAAAFGIR